MATKNIVLLLVLIMVLNSFFYETTAFKESSSESTKKKVLFYRSGWPKENFEYATGSTAMLRCNHVKFNGDARKAPPAFMRWFKDGELIKSLPGKIKIFGRKKRPFIKNTILNVTKLSKKDAGVYTCKLALRDTTPNPNYILSMNINVNVLQVDGSENNSTGNKIDNPSGVLKIVGNTTSTLPSPSNSHHGLSSDTDLPIELVIIGSASACLLMVSILLVSYKCSKNSSNKSNQYDTGYPSVEFTTPKDCSAKSGDSVSSDVFLPNNRLDTIYEFEELQPEYVNLGDYKSYFPFIKDEEWNLLQKSQISRQRIKCHVEHAMPIVLGTGNFGQVYQGEILCDDGATKSVAVKRLNDGCQLKEVGHFLKEAVSLLRTGHHPNVISLIGSVLLDTLIDLSVQQETKKPPILLMEVAEEGNLKSFLQTRRLPDCEILKSSKSIEEIFNSFEKNVEDFIIGKDLTLKDLASFLYQSARGMQHLADKKIVHRDLAARNVLVTSNRVIKIADFGLSKHIREIQQEYYRVHSPSVTPAKWTAPEALNENVFSVKSDVWSFGILAWEIYTMGGAPYLNVPIMQLYRHLAAGNRLEKPSFASRSIYQMMKDCWSWKAQDRPDFHELVQLTEDSLASLAEPYLEWSKHQISSSSSETCVDDLTSVTDSFVDPFDRPSTDSTQSRDSGRSSDSVFTFSSSESEDVVDDLNNSSVENGGKTKTMHLNELMNPVYGLP